MKSATKNSKKADRIVETILETYYGCYSEDNEVDDNFQLSPGDKELISFISQTILKNTVTIDDNRDFKVFQGNSESDGIKKCTVVKTPAGYLFNDFKSDADDHTNTVKRRRIHASNKICSAQQQHQSPSSVNAPENSVTESSINEYLQMSFAKSYEKYVKCDNNGPMQNGNNCSIDSESVSLMLQTLKESQENPGLAKLTVKGTIKCCICTKSKKPISVTWISNPLLVENFGQIAMGRRVEGNIGYWNLSNFRRHLQLKHKIIGKF